MADQNMRRSQDGGTLVNRRKQALTLIEANAATITESQLDLDLPDVLSILVRLNMTV